MPENVQIPCVCGLTDHTIRRCVFNRHDEWLPVRDLGRDRGRLNEQIEAIVQLRRTLPPDLLKPNQGYLDLTNPDRPELQLPVTTVPASEAPIP